ncbi:MAG: SCP2 sterol-binding domain-containing protein [Saprospiraceae bacterium]|nr:SCP2 sterol-binding domain-containing protein [Saprospiraceae bacterium]
MDLKTFLEKLPSKIDPDAVEGLSTRFHFDIADGGQFTLHLDNGKLSVNEGLEGDANCTVTASADTLAKLLSKDLNPMMAMMTGKLKISNPGEMLKYAKIFGLM